MENNFAKRAPSYESQRDAIGLLLAIMRKDAEAIELLLSPYKKDGTEILGAMALVAMSALSALANEFEADTKEYIEFYAKNFSQIASEAEAKGEET